MEENKSKGNEYTENEAKSVHSEAEIEALTVDLEDEEGNIIRCEIVDGFEFNNDEYAVVQNPEDETLYLFKVVGDDEVGELVLPDDDEFENARKYYESLIENEE